MYQEITPTGWAAQYVDRYWTYTNNTQRQECSTILPDGCTDIVISQQRSLKKNVVGCMSQPTNVIIAPTETMLGIRFKPGCARPFIHASMNELVDQQLSLHEINDIEQDTITPEMLSLPKKDITTSLDNFLKKIFIEKNLEHSICLAASYIIQHGGSQSIQKVANTFNISKRNLERKFLTSVGISPKLFSRIIRFQTTRSILKKAPSKPLISISLDSGYYDQAHFCREHKEFSGISPLNR